MNRTEMKENYKKNIGLILIVFILLSCTGGSKNFQKEHNKKIEIYYFKGLVDAAVPCDKEFSSSEVEDLGQRLIDTAVFLEIAERIGYLNKNIDAKEDNCNFRMQCNLYNENGSKQRLCISQFNCMVVNGEKVKDDKKLIYLLRKLSGYYNYFDSDVVKSFSEVEQFGVPDSYKNSNENIEQNNSRLYAKVVLLQR
ncbi:hypothetical protein H8S90_18065 [Olivibacter sp. SDN3]|uniref:hypothetical protein n=1 Tax=Olivibacter sp. SDN3 TaxID=2764720 RepID=UPI001650FE44|nr:hypothetical protein [Olivibacter sp. SDN3]QNL48675.1 hypothetical protein H8S90_18065 [Olivibacter sp. SDN3]